MSKRIIAVLFLVLMMAAAGFAQDETAAKKDETAKPKPDIADGKYGKFDRNVFDLWKPKSKKPTALVVYIHGGGFINGSKEKLSTNLLNELLKNGIAVMAINYRLFPAASFPDNYLDCARAIQFARFHAKDFNIDPKLVGATGSSAGGITSLWIGFHDDLADTGNADPVLRESTRLKAMAVFSAQTTVEPEIVRTRIGAAAMKHSTFSGKFFGLKADELNTPKAAKLFAEASPLHYLTKDDPPVWAFYSVSKAPLTDKSTTSDAIHHPNFGVVLKEGMDKVKIECKLRHKDDGQNVNGDMTAFLLKYLK